MRSAGTRSDQVRGGAATPETLEPELHALQGALAEVGRPDLADRVRIGRRTLLGSVASGISYGLIRASDGLPGSTQESLETLLATLELDDLVELTASSAGLNVRRKTCCLAFTLDEPKICSGCCIR